MKSSHRKADMRAARRRPSRPARSRTDRTRSSTAFRLSLAGVGTLLATGLASSHTFALLTDAAAGGPEQIATAALSPAPIAVAATNSGCTGTALRTNVGLSWSDSQSAIPGAGGGSLISGYSVERSASSSGPFSSVTSVSGSPAPLAASDAPPIGATSGVLVANTASQVFPISESTLTSGSAVAVGSIGNQVNAVQITPDGLFAVVAEFGSNQVQVLAWSGSAWSVAKSMVVASPTAVAIDPIPNLVGNYVAYVVSDPGTTVNGTVTPLTIAGSSTTSGTAVTIQHQATPSAIIVSPNGNYVYVANYNSGTVSAIATATSVVSTIVLPGGAPRPVSIAATFDSSHVYVADRANSYIDDIVASSNTVSAHVALAAGALNDAVLTTSGNPNILAMMPTGTSLYVAEFGTAEVQVIATALAASPDSIAATISTGAGSQPIDLAPSPNGCTVFVADWPSDKVFSIATSTQVESTVFTATCQTQDPQAMAVTPDNQYLVVPENYSCGDVQLVNTSTNAVTTIATVGTKPSVVAMQPIPMWYRTTATHAQWSSIPSLSVLFSAGWNPGGWQ
jgi:YVTN family beta-propeller protein